MNNTKTRWLNTLALALVLTPAVALRTIAAEKNEPKKQAIVKLGEDGKLKYEPDDRGNMIPDFSRCGYMGGGVKLPDLPVKLTLTPRPGMEKELEYYSPDAPEMAGTGDDTERIQKAIDTVSAMPLDKDGFRGAVLLKRGIYRVEGELDIKASGVVLRGEGQGKDGTIIVATSKKRVNLIKLGAWRKIEEMPDSRREIADSYVPWGIYAFNMKSTKGFSVGDKVVLYRPCTQNWLDDIHMSWKGMGKKEWKGKDYHFHFERQITAIDGNRITIDGPTVNAMEDKYGGGFVYKYTEKGAISQAGVENLRLISAFVTKEKEGTTDDEHGWTGVKVSGCLNSWVRNVTTLHFGFGVVRIAGNSKYVTIQDCDYLKPHSRWYGGRRYPFQFDDAQFCLIQRGRSENSRHCNSCRARVRGPNVYLDMSNGSGDTGPHHRWSMGILYDNCSGTHVARNRKGMGSGHGWAGAQIVAWNPQGKLRGNRFHVQYGQPPTARNYAFLKVKTRSLYIKQLEERLGKEALENVFTEKQLRNR